jgi:AcrR family transcriptional regulator
MIRIAVRRALIWYHYRVVTIPNGSTSGRSQELLTELIDLFLAEGFRELNLADLAKRLHCSKTTLYNIAPSKEQLIVAVVREYFRRATGQVEARLDPKSTAQGRVASYLTEIAEQLALGTPAFFADLAAFGPAREIYERNTKVAANRVKELVQDSGPTRSGVDPNFLGVFAGQLMEAINLGRTSEATSLDDAAAYRALADLIVSGIDPAT